MVAVDVLTLIERDIKPFPSSLVSTVHVVPWLVTVLVKTRSAPSPSTTELPLERSRAFGTFCEKGRNISMTDPARE
jgi:hypothetical protein